MKMQCSREAAGRDASASRTGQQIEGPAARAAVVSRQRMEASGVTALWCYSSYPRWIDALLGVSLSRLPRSDNALPRIMSDSLLATCFKGQLMTKTAPRSLGLQRYTYDLQSPRSP